MFGAIVFVFEHQMDFASGLDALANFAGHFIEPRRIADGVNRVEAQTIEAIFLQPIQRVFDKKPAYLRLQKIDGGSPR